MAKRKNIAAQFRLKYDSRGRIAVEQGMCCGMHISYNPDDAHFYLEAPDEDRTPLGIFSSLRNAVQRARERAKLPLKLRYVRDRATYVTRIR